MTPTFRQTCFWFGACIGFALEKGVWEFDSYIIEQFTYMRKSIIMVSPNIVMSIWYSTTVHYLLCNAWTKYLNEYTAVVSADEIGCGHGLDHRLYVRASVRLSTRTMVSGYNLKSCSSIYFKTSMCAYCVTVKKRIYFRPRDQIFYAPFHLPTPPLPPSPGYKCVKSDVSRH